MFSILKIPTEFGFVTQTIRQDQDFTSKFYTEITFDILKTFIKYSSDPQTPYKVMVSTDGRTDKRTDGRTGVFFFKVPRCFRGFQTLKHRGMVVAGTAQARSFHPFRQDRRFIRATANACRSDWARTLVGVSVDNSYIQRIVRS